MIRSGGIRIVRAASTEYFLVAEPCAQGDNLWRIAEIETDARMLSCAMNRHGYLTRVALVDGSRVRTTGRRRVQLALPTQVSDLHLDVNGVAAGELSAVADTRGL